MLELVCYLVSVIFGSLAVFAGPPFPAMDRTRLLAAAFTAFVIPFLVDAAQSV